MISKQKSLALAPGKLLQISRACCLLILFSKILPPSKLESINGINYARKKLRVCISEYQSERNSERYKREHTETQKLEGGFKRMTNFLAGSPGPQNGEVRISSFQACLVLQLLACISRMCTAPTYKLTKAHNLSKKSHFARCPSLPTSEKNIVYNLIPTNFSGAASERLTTATESRDARFAWRPPSSIKAAENRNMASCDQQGCIKNRCKDFAALQLCGADGRSSVRPLVRCTE
jgi:hypothetical protein